MEENYSANGDCFVAAVEILFNLDDSWTLVHAMVDGQKHLKGWRYSHAFVLNVDTRMVMDTSNGKKDSPLVMPAALYFAIGGIDPHSKGFKAYTKMEATERMLEAGHYGAWAIDGDLSMWEETTPETDKSPI